MSLRSPDGDTVGVQGPLDAQAPVIVLGVYELDDGDAVRCSAPPRRRSPGRRNAVSITVWMQQHRRSLLFLALMLAIGGIASALFMPVALFPNVAFPRVQLTLDAGDRPADQMAIEVTTPVEEAVRRVRGVRDVRSTTSRGSADIAISFDWGADMAAALQEVNGAAGQILPQLPAGTQLERAAHGPDRVPDRSPTACARTRCRRARCMTWPSTSCARC